MAVGLAQGKKLRVAIGFEKLTFARINAIAEDDERAFAATVRLLVREALDNRDRAASPPLASKTRRA